MSKLGQYITALVIGVFAIILVVMVATTAAREADPVKGSLVATLDKISAQNLRATAVAPEDVYGTDWKEVAILCPGYGADEIQQLLQVNASELGIEGEIPETENYLAVVNDEGQAYAEKFEISDVNLCAVHIPGSLDSRVMLPFVKSDKGAWTLAVS